LEIRAGSLHHIELYVGDLDRSAAFWGWLLKRLGWRPYQRWDRGRSWNQESTYLVLVRSKHRRPPYRRTRVGLNHLAFHATSKTQVDRLTRDLKSRRVRILYTDRHPHAGGADTYAVFFEDPDRMKVEVAASLPSRR
jgi:catechol 2,3-dioxygenase-like lactoylglutathione lyase family enzyme